MSCRVERGRRNQSGSGLDVALDEMLLYAGDSSHWEIMLITDRAALLHDNTGFNGHRHTRDGTCRDIVEIKMGLSRIRKQWQEEDAASGLT